MYTETTNITFAKEESKVDSPWKPYDEALRTIEMVYLIVLMVVGSLGNLLVISSIIHEKRVNKSGNIFVINLAVADLFATGVYVPTILANVVLRGDNALENPPVLCDIAGYGITFCCACSIQTLSVISINRYTAVVKNVSYKKYFNKYMCCLWVMFTWFWPAILMIPTLYGDWSGLRYDPKVMECLWNDNKSKSYNVFFMTLAIVVPLLVIACCYLKLFRFVKRRSKEILAVVAKGTVKKRVQNHSIRLLQRELTLIRTLSVAVACFAVCWLPYGLTIMIEPDGDKHLKKVVGWLGVSNSGANFIIYGLLSPTYRKGYLNLIYDLFQCKQRKRRMKRKNSFVASVHVTNNNFHKPSTIRHWGDKSPSVKLASGQISASVLRGSPKPTTRGFDTRVCLSRASMGVALEKRSNRVEVNFGEVR